MKLSFFSSEWAIIVDTQDLGEEIYTELKTFLIEYFPNWDSNDAKYIWAEMRFASHDQIERLGYLCEREKNNHSLWRIRDFIVFTHANAISYSVWKYQGDPRLEYATMTDVKKMYANPEHLQGLSELARRQKRAFSKFLYYRLGDADRVVLGENRKSRYCIYCRKPEQEIKFSTKSHSIPESLGNKLIFTINECDDCNRVFSQIDQTIPIIFGAKRSLFNIKGKKNKNKPRTPSYTSLNDELRIVPKNDNRLLIEVSNNSGFRLDRFHLFSYYSPFEFVPQNLYKALVRILLNSMEFVSEDSFPNTLFWINQPLSLIYALPPIAIRNIGSVVHQPTIDVILRDGSGVKLPRAFAILRVVDIEISFILPFDNDVSFINRSNYEYFFKEFVFWRDEGNYFLYDFGSISEVRLSESILLMFGDTPSTLFSFNVDSGLSKFIID